MILVLVFQKAQGWQERAAAIAGTIFGLLTSMSAVTGIIWYLTGNSDMSALYAMADAWNAFCDKTVLLWVVALIALAFSGVPLFVVISGITYVIFSKAGGYIDVLRTVAGEWRQFIVRIRCGNGDDVGQIEASGIAWRLIEIPGLVTGGAAEQRSCLSEQDAGQHADGA